MMSPACFPGSLFCLYPVTFSHCHLFYIHPFPVWIAEILKFTQIPHFSNYFCLYSELDCLSELTEMWSAVINLSGLLISKCIKYFTFSFPASFKFKKIIKLILEHRL